MSIYDPPIKPKKPAPAVPTVSYVRPDGIAPQGKFGSPSAMGFNPAYTPSVPKSGPSIWSQALTKVAGQAASSFLQSPNKPVQQLAYNSTIGQLASPEFLMNNNLSPVRGLDPSFKPTWQESIQAPLDAAGFMAAPMFTLGLAAADAAGVKNITGNTLLGTGAITTAINVYRNKGNAAGMIKALGPMVNALGFGEAANWVQENYGVNIYGLQAPFLQAAQKLAPSAPKPWPQQEYWQDATKRLTDTNTPIVNTYADPPWERGGYRFEPVNRSKGRVKMGGDAQGFGVFEDFNFQTGKWIERVPPATWMQKFMENFRNAITPQWKMQDPGKPSYNPLQITTTKPPPKIGDRYTPPPMNPDIPVEHRPRYDKQGNLTTEYLERELKDRDDWTTIDPESKFKPWEFLKEYIEKNPDSVNPESQGFLDSFWKTVKENPTLDQFKIWEIMTDDTGSTIRGKPWPPQEVPTTPWDKLKTTIANNAELDDWPLETQPSRDQQMLDAFWKVVKNNPNQDPYKIWDMFQKLDKEQGISDRSFDAGEGDPYSFNRAPIDPESGLPIDLSSLDPDDGMLAAEDYGDEQWENYKKSLREGFSDPDPQAYPEGFTRDPYGYYIDKLGNEWDSKDQFDAYQQSLQDYAAGQELGPMRESVEDATNRLAAQMAEGGERPVSYYQELLRQSFKTFEDLANSGTDFNRFPTDVTPNKWIEDNSTFLPSMMGTHSLFNNPKYSSGLGVGTDRNTDFSPWDSKPRPSSYFDEYGSFRTNNPLRSMGDEPIKSLPMGQLGVSDQIQLRRDLFMGADLDKLSEKTKKAIYESFDMGWHPRLGDDEDDNLRMGDIFEAITGSPQPESDVADGEYDTGNYAVEGYPLMEYINSPESGLPNLADYLTPTGQDAEGRMTFQGDYYKWEQDFREAWRDNPGLFRARALNPEFLPEWANPRYRDNAGE